MLFKVKKNVNFAPSQMNLYINRTKNIPILHLIVIINPQWHFLCLTPLQVLKMFAIMEFHCF